MTLERKIFKNIKEKENDRKYKPKEVYYEDIAIQYLTILSKNGVDLPKIQWSKIEDGKAIKFKLKEINWPGIEKIIEENDMNPDFNIGSNVYRIRAILKNNNSLADEEIEKLEELGILRRKKEKQAKKGSLKEKKVKTPKIKEPKIPKKRGRKKKERPPKIEKPKPKSKIDELLEISEMLFSDGIDVSHLKITKYDNESKKQSYITLKDIDLQLPFANINETIEKYNLDPNYCWR